MPNRIVKIVAQLQDVVSQPATQVIRSAQRVKAALGDISSEAELSAAQRGIRDIGNELNRVAREVQGTPLDKPIADLRRELEQLSRQPFNQRTARRFRDIQRAIQNVTEENNKLAPSNDRVSRSLTNASEASIRVGRAYDRLSRTTAGATNRAGGLTRATDRQVTSFGRLVTVLSTARQGVTRLAQASAAVPRVFLSATGRVQRFIRSLLTLRATIVTVIAVIGIRRVTQYADAYIQLENRLRLVTETQQEVNNAIQETFEIAQRVRLPLATVGDLYFRIARSSRELARDQPRVLRLTESIAQAIQLSGVSPDSANNALVQFSQGLASGNLGGDELRSVLEQTPRLGFAIAEGLGISFGELRERGARRELTTNAILGAIQRQQEVLAQEFSVLTPTIEQSTVVLNNAVGRLIGRTGQQGGITGFIAETIIDASKSIDRLTGALEADFLPFLRAVFTAAGNTFTDEFITARVAQIRADGGTDADVDAALPGLRTEGQQLNTDARTLRTQLLLTGASRRNPRTGQLERIPSLLQLLLAAVRSIADRLVTSIVVAFTTLFDPIRTLLGTALERWFQDTVIPVLNQIPGISIDSPGVFSQELNAAGGVDAVRARVRELVDQRAALLPNLRGVSRATGRSIGDLVDGFTFVRTTGGEEVGVLGGDPRGLSPRAQEIVEDVARINDQIDRLNQLIGENQSVINRRLAEDQDNTQALNEALASLPGNIEEANRPARERLQQQVSLFRTFLQTQAERFAGPVSLIAQNSRVAEPQIGLLQRISAGVDRITNSVVSRFFGGVRGQSVRRANTLPTQAELAELNGDPFASRRLRLQASNANELVSFFDAAEKGNVSALGVGTGLVSLLNLQRQRVDSLERQIGLEQRLARIGLEIRQAQATGDTERVARLQQQARFASELASASAEQREQLSQVQELERERLNLTLAIQSSNERLAGEGGVLSRLAERQRALVEAVNSGDLDFRAGNRQTGALTRTLANAIAEEVEALEAIASRAPELRDEINREIGRLNRVKDEFVEGNRANIGELDNPRDAQRGFLATLRTGIAQLNQFRVLGEAVGNTFVNAFTSVSNAIVGSIVESRNFGQAFREVSIQIFQDLAQLLVRFGLLRIASAFLGFGGTTGGLPVPTIVQGLGVGNVPEIPGGATGGLVRGRDGGDTNLVRARNREYMLPPESVNAYGVRFMDALRRRLIPASAADGLMAAEGIGQGGQAASARLSRRGAPVTTQRSDGISPALMLDGRGREQFARRIAPTLVDEFWRYHRKQFQTMAQPG